MRYSRRKRPPELLRASRILLSDVNAFCRVSAARSCTALLIEVAGSEGQWRARQSELPRRCSRGESSRQGRWKEERMSARPEHPEMSYRTLGHTGERVSAIGIGGWHLGLPHVDEQLSIRIVR